MKRCTRDHPVLSQRSCCRASIFSLFRCDSILVSRARLSNLALTATRELGAVDVGAGLAGGTDDVQQLQVLGVTLDGLGDGISIERHHQRYGLRGIFECMLPDQVVALVYRAAQRDSGLL